MCFYFFCSFIHVFFYIKVGFRGPFKATHGHCGPPSHTYRGWNIYAFNVSRRQWTQPFRDVVRRLVMSVKIEQVNSLIGRVNWNRFRTCTRCAHPNQFVFFKIVDCRDWWTSRFNERPPTYFCDGPNPRRNASEWVAKIVISLIW